MREGARGVPDGGGKEGRDQIRRHGRREGRSATGEERRAIVFFARFVTCYTFRESFLQISILFYFKYGWCKQYKNSSMTLVVKA
jgi:hypothetical protein